MSPFGPSAPAKTTPEQAEEVCQHIRTIIRKRFGSKNARAMTILYGGSMNEKERL